ncbi:MAG: NAD(P)-dependent alcohol dehydrogenase [Caldilineaceae bacterium]
METMKAVVCTKYGPPEVLKIAQTKKPMPREDELLIQICATSVTNSDLFIRSSKVPLRVLLPFRLMIGIWKPRKEIIGEVFAGIVAAVGSKITRFRVGDQVYGLTGFSLGAYAEYKCIKEVDSKQGCLAIKPNNISFEEATAAAYGGLLAFQFLEEAKIQPKQNVLIYGASGTSGVMALQLAKQLQAEVTGVCGPMHIRFVQDLGADHTLDYTDDNEIGKLATYDLVMDCVGKARSSALKAAAKRALTQHGKYISIDDAALLLDSSRLDRIRELIELGKIKPINDRCYALEQIVEAHHYVELGHKTGNVAITINNGITS